MPFSKNPQWLDKFKLKAKPILPRPVKPVPLPTTTPTYPKKAKIPLHFQNNAIVTYSQAEIKSELAKYPGLLKTLSHAYQYQITFNGSDNQKDYWFCRNLATTLPLLKYLNEQGWRVDWQEKPFQI